MKCDTLEVNQTPNEKVQLLGLGNTWLEGRGFSGRADEVSFDEAKGLYVLRSFNRHATIWREKGPGVHEPQHAQRLEFIPALNMVKVTHATSAEGSK